jgi:hypothetical protein
MQQQHHASGGVANAVAASWCFRCGITDTTAASLMVVVVLQVPSWCCSDHVADAVMAS